MALRKFGFIVTGGGLDPATHRMEMRSTSFTMIAAGVVDAVGATDVARAMVSPRGSN